MNNIRVLKDLWTSLSMIIKDYFQKSETNTRAIPIKIFIEIIKQML